MGSCVSSHKIPDSAPSNRWSVPNNDDKLLIPAPVPKPDGADRTLDHQCPSSPFRHAGSKEETFFDTQPWLESDCEDDFLSINGDFTPSGGSTPIHGSLRKTPENEATVVEGKRSAPVPADEQSHPAPPPLPHENKKLLSELFRESSRNHLYPDDENASGNVVPEKSKAAAVATAAEAPTGSNPVLRELINNRTPSNSGGSSERTTPNHHHHNNGVLKATNDKSGKSAQCCLPQLISSRSFSERRKKTSAAHTQAA